MKFTERLNEVETKDIKKIKCSMCGYDKFQCALEVHHVLKDGKRTGDITVLCANCHRIEHLETKEKRISSSLPKNCFLCPICKKRARTLLQRKGFLVCGDCYIKMEREFGVE